MNKDEHLEVLADFDTRSATVPLAEYLAAGRRRTGRECGSCSLCCKLPHIDIPELKKPRDTWCPHCRPGKGGCSIYQTRPGLCKAYTCLWLADPALGEEWKPSRCKIVVHFDPDGLAVLVDPAFPNRWREAPYYDVIKRAALHNLRQTGAGHHKTYVRVAGRTFLVLPRKDVEVTGWAHVVFMTGNHEWDARLFKTEAEAAEFTVRRNELEKLARITPSVAQ
jgi:hypothetical protein